MFVAFLSKYIQIGSTIIYSKHFNDISSTHEIRVFIQNIHTKYHSIKNIIVLSLYEIRNRVCVIYITISCSFHSSLEA